MFKRNPREAHRSLPAMLVSIHPFVRKEAQLDEKQQVEE
jgi:hypothetical protein